MDKNAINGLVLAGGRGQRMGGVDKGLQLLHGRPLVAHVLKRFAPQVGHVLISANRHLDDYAAFGLPVLADAEDDFKGPLAGLLAGLGAAEGEWLACAPCDVPRLPLDLVQRLAAARGQARIVLPRSADGRLQPLFALMHTGLRASLAAAIAAGQRRVMDWMLAEDPRILDMPQQAPGDFANINSLADLEASHD